MGFQSQGTLSQAFRGRMGCNRDPKTGLVKALDVTYRAGLRLCHGPQILVEGQFKGGAAMGGQGGMLAEERVRHKGHCVNPGVELQGPDNEGHA